MNENLNLCMQNKFKGHPLLRWRHFAGTIRRFVWYHFRPNYVQSRIAQRKGECRRCGACCWLAWRCPFFRIKDGMASCAIYKWFRFRNCHMFPISQHDLSERNAVFPETPCGYSWEGELTAEKKQDDLAYAAAAGD